jgi:hypothetical protein
MTPTVTGNLTNPRNAQHRVRAAVVSLPQQRKNLERNVKSYTPQDFLPQHAFHRVQGVDKVFYLPRLNLFIEVIGLGLLRYFLLIWNLRMTLI